MRELLLQTSQRHTCSKQASVRHSNERLKTGMNGALRQRTWLLFAKRARHQPRPAELRRVSKFDISISLVLAEARVALEDLCYPQREIQTGPASPLLL